MKWFGVEMDTVADSKLIGWFKAYLHEKGYKFESCGCFNNTLINVYTDEKGVYALNNAIDDYMAGE